MPGIGDGDVLADGDMPGIGAIVAAGTAEAWTAGFGEVFAAGAGVLIGMPGIGPMVGSVATAGTAHAATSAATRDKRGKSNDDLMRCSTYYDP